MTSSGSMGRWITVGFLAFLSIGLADRAEAQRFGRGPTPGAGACFYQDPDFQGEYFCVRAGDVVSNPPGAWHWHGATPCAAATHPRQRSATAT